MFSCLFISTHLFSYRLICVHFLTSSFLRVSSHFRLSFPISVYVFCSFSSRLFSFRLIYSNDFSPLLSFVHFICCRFFRAIISFSSQRFDSFRFFLVSLFLFIIVLIIFYLFNFFSVCFIFFISHFYVAYNDSRF